MAGIAAELLEPPVNVLRLSLHPQGLAPRIANLGQWRHHIIARLRRQVELTADPVPAALLEELRGYAPPGGAHDSDVHAGPLAYGELALPLRLRTEHGLLSFVSTTTVFGTAVDVTLSELAIESFFPADAATGEVLRNLGLPAGRQVQRMVSGEAKFA
jgi:hypothetical protein